MNDSDSDYEFYVGTATHLEGASLAIDGTARIDGKIVGKVAVKHLIVGPGGVVQGDISGETAKVEGTVEDSLTLTGKFTVCSSGRIRGKIQYGSIETMEGANLSGRFLPIGVYSTGEPVAFTSSVTTDGEESADDICHWH